MKKITLILGLIILMTSCDFLNKEKKAIDYLSKYNLETAYVQTNSENIFNTFTGGVPQIFIYKNEQLKKHFVGETEISLIAELIKIGLF